MFRKTVSFFEKKFCPRQRSCPGQVVCSEKSQIFEKKFCPWQRSCPGQVVSSEKNQYSAKSSAPGSEAAWDKWLLIKRVDFLEKVLPQAAKLPGTSDLFKKSPHFEKNICPRQRSCPGQVVSSKKKIFWKKFCPRQRSCPGQVASSSQSSFSGKRSAPGSEVARDKWFLNKKYQL